MKNATCCKTVFPTKIQKSYYVKNEIIFKQVKSTVIAKTPQVLPFF